jgi:hypothetical protein
MLRCASYPDPDDLIFPRTTTRLGTKYQASIPLKDGPRDPGKNKLRHYPVDSDSPGQLKISKSEVGRQL